MATKPTLNANGQRYSEFLRDALAYALAEYRAAPFYDATCIEVATNAFEHWQSGNCSPVEFAELMAAYVNGEHADNECVNVYTLLDAGRFGDLPLAEALRGANEVVEALRDGLGGALRIADFSSEPQPLYCAVRSFAYALDSVKGVATMRAHFDAENNAEGREAQAVIAALPHEEI